MRWLKHLTSFWVGLCVLVLHLLASFVYTFTLQGVMQDATVSLAVRSFFFLHWFPWTSAEMVFGDMRPTVLMFLSSAVFWAFTWAWAFRFFRRRFADEPVAGQGR